MKMNEIKSLTAIAVASFLLASCAGSNEGTTAMDDSVTMTETQTMTGTADEAEEVTVAAAVVEPVAVIPIASLSLTNSEDVGDMFENVGETENYSIVDLAKQSANLSTFVQLFDASGLAATLKPDAKYTLFAPTNEAFSKLSKADLEMLLLPENKAKLSSVLMAHIIPQEVHATAFKNNQRIKLDEDRYIPITTTGPGQQITVGGANVVVQNVEASNGVIHVIDNVIIPANDAVDGNGIR